MPEIPPELSDEEVGRDPRLMEQLQKAVTEWALTIQETIKREDEIGKSRPHETASGETEFWNSRSATFNTLNQQLSMHSVKRIENVCNGFFAQSESEQATLAALPSAPWRLTILIVDPSSKGYCHR